MDALEVFLLLRNVQEFVAGAEKSAAAVKEVGVAAETTGKKGAAGWKGMAKWAVGSAAIYGGVRAIKSAVDSTTDLAKSTYAVQKQTGMAAEASSELVSVTKERGISTQRLQIGLTKLSKTMDASRSGTAKESKSVADLRRQIDAVAAAGGKKAPGEIAKLSRAIVTAQGAGEKARKVMQQLGVPLSALRKGNTEAVLMKVADAFKAMPDGAQKAALAAQLFGSRVATQLLPVLSQGSEGVRKMMEEQKAQGNYLSQKGVDSTRKYIAEQRHLEAAFKGVRVTLGLALLPVLLGLTRLLSTVMDVLKPVTSHVRAMQAALLLLVGALVVWKAALMAAEFRQALVTLGILKNTLAVEANTVVQKEATLATKLWAGAQWLLNAALDANPIVLVAVAVVALGVAIFVAYKKVKWFHEAVDDAFHAVVAAAQFAWKWLKQNWPLVAAILLGPFAVAGLEIYRHFAEIKKWAWEAVDAVKGAFNSLVNFIKTLPARLGGWIKKIPALGKVLSVASKVGGLASKVGLQAGGVVTRAGGFLVGERGPEVVALPAGAAVTPMPASMDRFGGGGHAGGPLEIHVPVMLDGREIGRSVARVAADKLARR